VRTRAGAVLASLLFFLSAAPALGKVDSFSWGFTRAGAPGGLALHVSDNESGNPAPVVIAFRATFPSNVILSGSPSSSDVNVGCELNTVNKNVMECRAHGGLSPGSTLDVTGFSSSPALPDGGGSSVQFSVQHTATGGGVPPFDPAGTGTGPPDPCPKNAAPTGPASPHPGSSHDPLNRFITQAYRDLLGRAPTSGETKHFHAVLESGAATREQVALAILSSPEYRGKLARSILKEYFRRGATPTEAASGRNQLGAHGDEAYRAALMGSAEYFTKCAHSDDTSFIQHAYRDVLGRDPTGSEISFWKGKDRDPVVIGLLSSDEYFLRVA